MKNDIFGKEHITNLSRIIFRRLNTNIMKKLIIILFILATALALNGCDFIFTPRNHYVSIYNDENAKYITSVYYSGIYSYDNLWSRNMITSEIYPYEYEDLLIEEGTYDFKVIMEDDYYSYEIYESSIYVNTDIRLEICVDCYGKDSKVKVTRTPKAEKMLK